MMGEVDRRVSAFIEIARRRIVDGDVDLAIEFFSRALSLDPERLEVHVDLAELEIARGKTRAAIRRLEAVAEAYVDTGNIDAAADVLEFAAALERGTGFTEPGAVQGSQTGFTEPMGILLPTPRQRPREETVLARTILLFPDGSPMPIPSTTPVRETHRRPPPPHRARFRVSPPPMLRRPR
jgi:tetratricopeptide (TPR) repeat protein